MWRNYWTVAVRALAKSKTYSIINIAGLAIGMAACMMILLYIRYEQSYDKWLPDAENTYQFQSLVPASARTASRSFLQMSAYVAKDRDQEGFPAGRARRLRAGQRAGLHQGRPGDADQGLSVRRRRFPEGRQPAARCRRPTPDRAADRGHHAERGDQALRHRPGGRPHADGHLAAA